MHRRHRGPNLQGIIDRRVASAPDFAYSQAMKHHGGAWSRKRLDEFLADPAAVVKGDHHELRAAFQTQSSGGC